TGTLAHLLRIGHLTQEDIRWDDIDGNPEGIKRLWPAAVTPVTSATPADRQLYAEGGSEPAARPEESTPEPAPAAGPELAPTTQPPRVESAPPPAPAQATPEPVPAPPATKPSQSPQAQRQLGGRPTDRDMVLEEAAWRLRAPERTKAK